MEFREQLWDVLLDGQYIGYVELIEGKYHPTSEGDGHGGPEFMLLHMAGEWLKTHAAESDLTS
jgi:hypothetical protein